jgi:hypothetical protein
MMMDATAELTGARLAIYYAPQRDTALARFGRAWFGRDPETGEEVERLSLSGVARKEIVAWTTLPRRYGFHLTLKPPFHLAEGLTLGELFDALAEFASAWPPMTLPSLFLATVAGCLVLSPASPSPDAVDLAAACVARFDGFRRPPSAAELAGRRAAGLTSRQNELLVRWGYPYVMEEARIALTFTGPLEDTERNRAARALEPALQPLCRDPVAIEDLCVFLQVAPAADFTVARRFRLGG